MVILLIGVVLSVQVPLVVVLSVMVLLVVVLPGYGASGWGAARF